MANRSWVDHTNVKTAERVLTIQLPVTLPVTLGKGSPKTNVVGHSEKSSAGGYSEKAISGGYSERTI